MSPAISMVTGIITPINIGTLPLWCYLSELIKRSKMINRGFDLQI